LPLCSISKQIRHAQAHVPSQDGRELFFDANITVAVPAILLHTTRSRLRPDLNMSNRKCGFTLIDPARWVNGQIVPGASKQVSRTQTAQYLQSCRTGKATVMRLNTGTYTILPHGLQHGFKLQRNVDIKRRTTMEQVSA